MKLIAKAKINLRLKCISKYQNGYHELEMINKKINLFDEIDISISDKNELIYINSTLDPRVDNLVIKVIEYFQDKYNIKDYFKVVITKNIPVGAGLGGGSSDAASIIHYLNNTYMLGLQINDLINIAVKFGADIPYCLFDETCVVRKTGEDINPIKLNLDSDLFIINPNIYISTKDVFKLNKKFSKKTDLFNINNIYDYLDNDLEIAATEYNKELINVKEYLSSLPHCGLVMSGSGSTYVLLCNKDNSEYIYSELKKNTNWFIYKEK